jgi:glucose/arabinose dehydrogenase
MKVLAGFLVSLVAFGQMSCSRSSGLNTTSGAGGGGASSTGSAPGAGGNAGAGGRTPSGTGGGATSSTGGSVGASGKGGGGGSAAGGPGGIAAACSGAVHSTAAAGPTQPSVALTVPSGFALTTIAMIAMARQLAALPNGDLLVATNGTSVYLVPNADGTTSPGAPVVFTTTGETPAQGIAFDPSSCTIYLSSEHNIYAMAYVDAQQGAVSGTPIANVRTGDISPNRPSGDTDNHTTTSVAFASGSLYAGVGSSCNACVETDPTRASIQQMGASGANMTTRATRFRNAIALTANPATGTLWAGGAGQDNLADGHPFEFFDAVTLHPGVADYGWPSCEEDHVAYTTGATCTTTVAPLIEMPAYSTIIGATFYPSGQTGAHAFPASYKGGVFLAAHGSWHANADGTYVSSPQVVYVPMNGDVPRTAVDWSDPTKQWTQFVGGFQLGDGKTRVARPTGISVGALGSLFIADDQNGYIYRVRPN